MVLRTTSSLSARGNDVDAEVVITGNGTIHCGVTGDGLASQAEDVTSATRHQIRTTHHTNKDDLDSARHVSMSLPS